MRRTLLTLTLAVLALALVPGHVQAQSTAPTLTGEILFDLSGTAISTDCNADGSGTIDFSASGPITIGPYSPGSFTAQGQIVLGSAVGAFPFSRAITSITETFTITSTTGQVVGEKSGALPLPGLDPPTGTCERTVGPGVVTTTAETRARYSALITRNGEVFLDEGTTDVHLFGQVGPGEFELGTLDERFISDFATAQHCDKFKDKPGTDKDKCKDKNKP